MRRCFLLTVNYTHDPAQRGGYRWHVPAGYQVIVVADDRSYAFFMNTIDERSAEADRARWEAK
jgi:hypothetical protein